MEMRNDRVARARQVTGRLEMRTDKKHDDAEFEWDMTAVAILVLVIMFLLVAAVSILPFGHAS